MTRVVAVAVVADVVVTIDVVVFAVIRSFMSIEFLPK